MSILNKTCVKCKITLKEDEYVYGVQWFGTQDDDNPEIKPIEMFCYNCFTKTYSCQTFSAFLIILEYFQPKFRNLFHKLSKRSISDLAFNYKEFQFEYQYYCENCKKEYHTGDKSIFAVKWFGSQDDDNPIIKPIITCCWECFKQRERFQTFSAYLLTIEYGYSDRIFRNLFHKLTKRNTSDLAFNYCM